MENGQFGTPHPKDGNALPLDGSRIPSGLSWHCMQVRKMLSEMSEDLSTQITTRSAPTGHDAGDEDPNAWA